MNKTKWINSVYNIVCIIASLGAETKLLPIPEAYKHYVSAIAMLAMWLKSHWNLFVDPKEAGLVK